MDTRAGPPPPSRREGRSARDLELDLEVGLRIEGYRWVEWNHDAIRQTPLDQPGRFVGHPGDLLAHLYADASADVPLAEGAFARLPPYSLEAGPALRAAERAGLFRDDGAAVSCTRKGTWRLRRPDLGVDVQDDCLPRLLTRAALLTPPAREGGEP